MTIVSVPIPIPVKNGVIMLEEDSIYLLQSQVDKIKQEAIRKTQHGWLTAGRGVKIPLTTQQQIAVVGIKDQLMQLLSPTRDPREVLLQRRGFGFAKHAFERILERIERLSTQEIQALGVSDYRYAVHPETLENVVASLMESQTVQSFAEWKGYPYLNYCFVCNLDDRELDVVVNFELGILIITLIINKETGYFVREVYS
ncbi:hypothetical protein, partial [Cytobacillus oceanisediminis]|uniref:hypothetical protein n=1 Tax=Cytobacillus oceanisediminis TaxID=665099 RepID=UPI0011A072D0